MKKVVVVVSVILLLLILLFFITKKKNGKKWTKSQKKELHDILAKDLVCFADTAKTNQLIKMTADKIMAQYAFTDMSDPVKTAEIDKILAVCIAGCKCKVLPWDIKDRDAAMKLLAETKANTFCPLNAEIDLAIRGCIIDNQSHIVSHQDFVRYWTTGGLEPKIAEMMEDSQKHCLDNILCVAPPPPPPAPE